ncbi:hypothetical protein [Pseudomonas sp. SDO524_S393]
MAGQLAHMFHVLDNGDDWGQEQINEHAQAALLLIEAQRLDWCAELACSMN